MNSITNQSLRDLAQELGWQVQVREVTWNEVAQGTFAEVAACGTAVVLTMVNEIWKEAEGKALEESEVVQIPNTPVDGKETYLEGLKRTFKEIQRGEYPEWQKFGWMWPYEGL